MISSRYFRYSLILFCILLALVDPFVFGRPVILPVRIVFWLINGIVVLLSWYLQFVGLAWALGRMGSRFAVPSAVMIAAAVFLVLHLNYAFAGWLLDEPDLWREKLYPDIFRYWLVGLVFETVTAVFLLPRLLEAFRRGATAEPDMQSEAPPDAAEPEVDAAPALPDRIEASGKRYELTRLLYLKSAEHYVEVVLHDATELVRASLREMTDMLHPSQGVQPHRSYWVNRDAIVGLNRADGGQFLVLRNGHEIPVSRHRRRDVADWIAAHVLDQVSG